MKTNMRMTLTASLLALTPALHAAGPPASVTLPAQARDAAGAGPPASVTLPAQARDAVEAGQTAAGKGAEKSAAARSQGGVDVTVGDLVSQWESDEIDATTGYFPVTGSGQLNGEFVVARKNGIELGLRITDRTDGLLEVQQQGAKGGRYQALTGFDDEAQSRAEWNYDIHVDLRGEGSTTLGDYRMTLSQSFSESLGTFDVTFPEVTNGTTDNAFLYQQSWNPVFFNDDFDPTVEGTYTLVLRLKPKNGGQPLIVRAQVVVVSPEGEEEPELPEEDPAEE